MQPFEQIKTDFLYHRFCIFNQSFCFFMTISGRLFPDKTARTTLSWFTHAVFRAAGLQRDSAQSVGIKLYE